MNTLRGEDSDRLCENAITRHEHHLTETSGDVFREHVEQSTVGTIRA